MAGYKNFAAGAVLGESDLDDYLMRQTVMTFASGAARDTALSGVLLEGMVTYLLDENVVQMYNGAAWVQAFALQDWKTYTPACHQSVGGSDQTLTIRKARWTRSGLTIKGTTHVTISGAGSSTNGVAITMSMPVTPADTTATIDIIGSGYISDAGSIAFGVQVSNNLGTFSFVRTDATVTNFVGADPGFALAAGDIISFSYQYEAAL